MQDFSSKLDTVLACSAAAQQQQSTGGSPASEAAAPPSDAVHVTLSVGERGYVTLALHVGPAKHPESREPSSSKADLRGMKAEAAQGKSGQCCDLKTLQPFGCLWS